MDLRKATMSTGSMTKAKTGAYEDFPPKYKLECPSGNKDPCDFVTQELPVDIAELMVSKHLEYFHQVPVGNKCLCSNNLEECKTRLASK